MTRTSISPLAPCVGCNEEVSDGYLRVVMRRPEILCDECYEREKVQLTFIHSSDGNQLSQTHDVILRQTVDDVLGLEGLSLAPDAARSGAPPLQLLREGSEDPLPGDQTLQDLGIKDGDRLIVRYAG